MGNAFYVCDIMVRHTLCSYVYKLLQSADSSRLLRSARLPTQLLALQQQLAAVPERTAMREVCSALAAAQQLPHAVEVKLADQLRALGLAGVCVMARLHGQQRHY